MGDRLTDLAEFRKDLQALINQHGLDTVCNTPDYALADFMVTATAGYLKTVIEHDRHQPSGFTRTVKKPVKTQDER